QELAALSAARAASTAMAVAFVAPASPLRPAGATLGALSHREVQAPRRPHAELVTGAAAAGAVTALRAKARARTRRSRGEAKPRVVRRASKAVEELRRLVHLGGPSAEKALAVNLDNNFYGSFAEIGAGQEVSRTFLQAGAAAGTVARSISAYDMKMSDVNYGKAWVTP
ncbi:unnamed protein product, partial [Effrenium voratum]